MSDKLTYGGSWLYIGGSSVSFVEDPYNPLHLPPYTLRCRFTNGYTPTQGTARVQVSSSPNIWDITKDTFSVDFNGVTWGGLFYDFNQYTGCAQLLEVLGANATGVVNMQGVFEDCSSLTSVVTFDASSARNCWGMFEDAASLVNAPDLSLDSCRTVGSMFYRCFSLVNPPNLTNTSGITTWAGLFSNCSSLNRVPLYDTSSGQYFGSMLHGCRNVAGGAYELYQQVSQQSTVINHLNTFKDCGADTVIGRHDLLRIPESWGGNMA